MVTTLNITITELHRTTRALIVEFLTHQVHILGRGGRLEDGREVSQHQPDHLSPLRPELLATSRFGQRCKGIYGPILESRLKPSSAWMCAKALLR